jgi:hypothetical protein
MGGEVNGIIYLLNQAGEALAQANTLIAELQARITELESAQESPEDR